MKAYITRFGASFLMLLFAAGCGGGAGAPSATTLPSSSKRAAVTFTIHWPSAQAAAHLRKPQYVSASTAAVGIVVNGGTPQYVNNPGTGSSTLQVSAPVGNDTFAITAYDQAQTDGASPVGNVLSRSTLPFTVALNSANAIAATLGGVVASVTIVPSSTAPNAGMPQALSLAVNGYDADGNLIIGAANYDQAVTLTNSDATGHAVLNTTSVTSPSTIVSVAFDGNTITPFTIGWSGHTATSPSIRPVPVILALSMPGSVDSLSHVTTANDGSLWYTGYAAGSIVAGKYGGVGPFTLPDAGCYTPGISQGSDGNFWIVLPCSDHIDKMTPAGVFTSYTVPGATNLGADIIAGSDGNLWAADQVGAVANIVRITPAGVVTQFAIPTGNQIVNELCLGPDGAIWFVERAALKIGRVDTAGAVTEFPLTTATDPVGIAAGPDGKLWFAQNGTAALGTLTTAGVFGSKPTTDTGTQFLLTALDKNVWFVDFGSGAVGRYATDGIADAWPAPATGSASNPLELTQGGDGNLYYVDNSKYLREIKLVYP